MLKRLAQTFLSLFVVLWLSGSARAHDPGLSAAEVRVGATQIVVHLSIAYSDVRNILSLGGELNGRLTESEIAAVRPRLDEFGRGAIDLMIEDRRVAARSVEIGPDETGAAIFRISYDREAGSRITIRSTTVKSLARGHREYVSVNDEHGKKVGDKVLDATSDELVVDLGSTTQALSVFQFVQLGIEHILMGYDHLVFLFGLLLAGAGIKDVAKIITSFTAAHSITLALATLDVVRVPAVVVEPLIAVSIIYVGIENILRRDLKWRWLLTFGFGLFHGFGFASVLRDLGIGSGAAAAIPLISFNVGVESGQLAVSVLALPLIWRLRKRPIFVARFAPACSILISTAGVFWLVERMLGK